jgi:hypothetical protein
MKKMLLQMTSVSLQPVPSLPSLSLDLPTCFIELAFIYQYITYFTFDTFDICILVQFYHKHCDQKLASDSSGLPGGFSGQRAWVRIFKKMGARQLLS